MLYNDTYSTIVKHGKTNSELVQHYTSHYHAWVAESYRAQGAITLTPNLHPNIRLEMKRRKKWATDYASSSAALAVYHLKASMALQNIGDRPPSPVDPAVATLTGTTAGGECAIAIIQCIQNLGKFDERF